MQELALDRADPSATTDSAPAWHAPLISIILPTFNEVGGVREMYDRLGAVLGTVPWEAVFVDDDSSDGTPEAVSALARTVPNVRLLRRIGRRGLSSAVIEGACSSSAQFIAVMDADQQHDERALLPMLEALRAERCDIAIGTRYSDGGSIGDWPVHRARMSGLATALSHVVGHRLTDPMSGFFAMRLADFLKVARNLSPDGFKILIDIVTTDRSLRVLEVPYTFRERHHGQSKLDFGVGIQFMALLASKVLGGVISPRFMIFCAVGFLGLAIHTGVLALAFAQFKLQFWIAQTVATYTAMTVNFFVNNILTFRDRRLRGAGPLLFGLISFMALCSLGAFANVGIANYVFAREQVWWLSGIVGALVGAVWNYAASSAVTWRAR